MGKPQIQRFQASMVYQQTNSSKHSQSSMLVLCSQSYRQWTEHFLSLAPSFEKAELVCKNFPDGERYHRIVSEIDEKQVIIVSGTVSDSETLELFDLANAAVDGGATRLHIILPYFGYSTMERAVKSGEAVKAKYRARLLSNGIPQTPGGNRIYMLDLHSEGIPQYFEKGIQSKHVYAKPLVMRAALTLASQYGSNGLVLASTDAGRMKWVESLARDMAVPPAFAFKERLDMSKTVTLAISGPVKNKLVVIYDDMIRTGSSLLNAAKAYLDAGASAVAAIATHALFPADSLQKIQNSGLIKQIVVTDSHPRARELECDFLKVESCAELFLPYTNVAGLADEQKEMIENA